MAVEILWVMLLITSVLGGVDAKDKSALLDPELQISDELYQGENWHHVREIGEPGSTEPPSSGCKDKHHWCKKSKHLCKRVYEGKFFRRNCRKTCGTCEYYIYDPPVPPRYQCRDKRPWCEDFTHHCPQDSPRYQEMDKYCRKTCNFCSGEQQEPPSSVCEDTAPWCKDYLHRCEGHYPNDYVMDKYCRKSCGFCHEEPQGPPEPPSSVCEDNAPWCKEFINQCEEDHPNYHVMDKYCRKSCGFCHKDPQGPPEPPGSVCEDNAPWCKEFLNQCGEDHPAHHVMNEYCRKSCRFCHEEQPEPQGPPGPPSSVCEDNRPGCKAQIHQCEENHPGFWYMNKFCRKTCRFCNETTTCKCGIPNTSRIVGGDEVNFERKYPWQVSLVYPGSGIDCGGSIINDRWILTAAHCIIDKKTCQLKNYNLLSILNVLVGEHDQEQIMDDDSNTNLYHVKTWMKHPKYSCGTKVYDFALLELTEAIPFNHVIRPICLPKDDSKTYVGQIGIVSGWGQTSTYRFTSQILKEVQVPILPNDKCGYWSTRSPSELCAGGETGEDFCYGDSGGPLSVYENGKYVQVGVASYGDKWTGCGSNSYPGIYARTSKVIEWISRTTANGMKCY